MRGPSPAGPVSMLKTPWVGQHYFPVQPLVPLTTDAWLGPGRDTHGGGNPGLVVTFNGGSASQGRRGADQIAGPFSSR